MILVRLFSIFSNETLIIESFLIYLLIILSQPLYLFSSGMIQQIPELNASKQLLLKFPVVFKETKKALEKVHPREPEFYTPQLPP